MVRQLRRIRGIEFLLDPSQPGVGIGGAHLVPQRLEILRELHGIGGVELLFETG